MKWNCSCQFTSTESAVFKVVEIRVYTGLFLIQPLEEFSWGHADADSVDR